MATRLPRSDTGSSLGDSVDERCEGEDPQTQQDYDEFKQWLASLDAEKPHPSQVDLKPSEKTKKAETKAFPGPPSQSESTSSSSGSGGNGSTTLPSGDFPLPCSTCGKLDSCNMS